MRVTVQAWGFRKTEARERSPTEGGELEILGFGFSATFLLLATSPQAMPAQPADGLFIWVLSLEFKA